MIQEIVKEPFILSQKSKEATMNDLSVLQDLKDTLQANQSRCVGMAANMIGCLKRIIVFYDGDQLCAMINPEYLKKEKSYHTEEGCLSLDGTRETIRYESIKVKYYDESFKIKIKTFKGFTAQIIQHEMDHLEGILI